MSEFLLLACVFLMAGVVAVPIASRLRLGSVLGCLIAGIAISPLLHSLGVDVISIQHSLKRANSTGGAFAIDAHFNAEDLMLWHGFVSQPQRV